MNLLSFTGALLTASASVFNHPLQQPKSKMMDVENKYQSNEVIQGDITTVIVGNIYYLDFYGLSYDDIFAENYDEYLFCRIIHGDMNVNGSFDDSTYLTNVNSNVEIEVSYFSFKCAININDDNLMFSYSEWSIEDYSENDDYMVVQILNDNGLISDRLSYYLRYTDYNEIVPSTSHRGNLYTTIYDFFYGIFDTSDTNELSMTIMGQSMSLTSWLAHSVTIILLFLGVLWLILVIRWIFRVCAGLVHV